MFAVVFPGQGSQYIGMGKDFFENFEKVKDFFNKAEKLTDIPIKKLCFEGPLEELTQTKNLQVCLTLINVVCYEVLKEFLEEKKINLSYVAGHSLGEFSALYVSEVLSFEDTFIAVKERGKLMEEEGKKGFSTMYAIIGLPLEDLKNLLKYEKEVTISNYNSPKQFVISGKIPEIDKIAQRAKELGAKTVKLKVSAGFHSPLMKSAEEKFSQILEKLTWKNAKIPFVSNISGREEIEGSVIRELMKKQIVSSVRWIECINYMYNKGVRIFIEIGPKRVLSGLISQILEGKEYKIYNIENSESLENFIKNF